jgi:hypothetical protein
VGYFHFANFGCTKVLEAFGAQKAGKKSPLNQMARCLKTSCFAILIQTIKSLTT